MRFRVHSNLKTAPNIGEVSFVSAIGPLLEWNVPVFPMANRRSRAPRPLGPMHSVTLFPPLATPLLIGRGGLAIGRTGRIPGGLAANLARCPAFCFYIYNLLLLFYIVVVVVVFVAYRMY